MPLVRVAILACLASIGLTACDSPQEVIVVVYPNTPVELVTWPHVNGSTVEVEKKTVLLQPEAPEHRQLGEWLASNQNGWRKLAFEKGPSDGVFVTFADCRLHFCFGTVTLRRGDATFMKDIREDDYTFLKRVTGI